MSELARLKMGSVVVDSEAGLGGVEKDVDTDPNKKAARVEALVVWRIHLIPLVMVFVFVILWAGSTEILPEDSAQGVLVTRVAVKSVPSEQLKVVSDEAWQPGIVNEPPPHFKHTPHDLSTDGLAVKEHMRGVTR